MIGNSKKYKKIKVVNSIKWVLPTNKEFPEWISKTFSEYELKNNKLEITNTFKPYKYQLFLKDYMQKRSPYRGVLLYHGLGSGKTCSAIQIAENLKFEKDIIVLLPASLKQNFLDSLSFCGNNSQDKYEFISYNSSTVLNKLKEYENLDNKVIIVDEVHKLISMIINEGKQGREIYKMFMKATNTKFIFLSGTPIINLAYELAIISNILRGYIEITIYNIKSVNTKVYGENWNMFYYIKKLEELEGVDYVDVNVPTKTVQIHIIYDSNSEEYTQVKEAIQSLSLEEEVELVYNKISNYTLFPEKQDEFDEYFIKDDSLIRTDVLSRRLTGIVSYFRGANPNLYPELKPIKMINVLMSQYQFREYKDIREKEKQQEKTKGKKKTDLTKKSVSQTSVSSTFRIYSREFSNFVFPAEIPRPTKSGYIINTQLRKKNKNNKINLEEELQNSKNYMKKINKTLNTLKLNSNKFLTPKSLELYSPKMLALLNNLKTNNGLVLIYSDFRAMEGVGILSMILETNGYTKYNYKIPKYTDNNFALYTGTEDKDERKEILKVFTSSENKKGEKIKILFITSAGTQGLDLKNIRHVHILEPYWNEAVIKQIIGRAVRVNSHINLPKDERNVQVYRYMSILDKEQLREMREKESTDEYIYNIAIKKAEINENIEQIMKEVAIDCILNKKNNEKVNCFSYSNTNMTKKRAYLPDIKKNIVYNRKSKKKITKLIDGGIDNKNRIIYANKSDKKLYLYTNREKSIKTKIKKRIAINPITLEVYDYKLAKLGKKEKIGDVGINSSFIKK